MPASPAFTDSSEPVPLRLGTRGSRLARIQSRAVADRIEAATDLPVTLVEIRTQGDADQDRPLREIGGAGVFTREVDHALLGGEVDLAVHSMKDLPTVLPDGVALAAVPEREDPRDALVGREDDGVTLDALPAGARVGTSSTRRRALLLASRPDLRVDHVRGNVETRIAKVDDGDYDAVLLSAAGLARLGLGRRVGEAMDPGTWVPAPAQGALAVVVRAAEIPRHHAWIRALDHHPSRSAALAERAVLHELGAGCSLPVGAFALAFGGGLRLRAAVLAPDGRRLVRADITGAQEDAVELGTKIANRLRDRGAEELLASAKQGDLARNASISETLSR